MAEGVLIALNDAPLLARVRQAADSSDVTPGTLVAATIRHLLDHAGDDVWLGLIGRMAGSPQPGATALQAILAQAFPDAPVARPTDQP